MGAGPPSTYVPCPSPPRVWLDGSARAAPPGRVLGGRAYPPEPPAPPGLSHAPALPPNTRQPACQSARPGAARSLAQPPAALQPMSTPAPGPLPAPPRAPRAHRGRIQHRAPAGGPTRRVCLGRANGAIVPPPDPAARLSSLVRGDSTVPGKRGGAVVARAAGSWEEGGDWTCPFTWMGSFRGPEGSVEVRSAAQSQSVQAGMQLVCF